MVSLKERLKRNVAPHIWNIKPYSSARHEFQGDASIYLDANENPYPGTWNRYPDTYQNEIKSKWADINKVTKDNILLCNGSDECIDLIIRLFCVSGKDEIIICPPTYGMYSVSASIQNIDAIEIPLTESFELNVSKIQETVSEFTKLIFICSPNNPTGNLINREYIRTLLHSFQGFIIVDEAYIDFSDQRSLAEWMDEFPQLLILQTFSKAWGLAAARVGICLAHSAIIQLLQTIKPPYNISGPSQFEVLKQLNGHSLLSEQIKEVKIQRGLLAERLSQIPAILKVFPSQANFLLIKVQEPDKLYKYLLANGIIIRNRSQQKGCEGCVRITIGTPFENKLLLNQIKAFYGITE